MLGWSPETAAKLSALHPQRPPPEVPPPPPGPAHQVDLASLDRLVAGLPSRSGPGPSGLRYEHVRQCWGVAQFRSALLNWINMLLAGECPRSPPLLTCRLVALAKPGGGVRPVAVAEVLLRLADMAAVAALNPAARALAPLQLGAGLKGGIDAARWATHAAAHQDPTRVVVALDFTNAFNCLDRTAMLKAVAERAPAALAYSNWKYASPSPLVWSSPQGSTVLESSTGVRQGDPCGPALFALGLQHSLLIATAAVPDVQVVAYLDDVYIVGKGAEVEQCVHVLRQGAAQVGLHMNPAKCQVLSTGSEDSAAELAQRLGMQHAAAGMRVLGSWLGPGEATFAEGVVSKVNGWLQALMDLDISAQAKLLLARKSGWARPLYLARSCSGGAAVPALATAKDALMSAVATLAHQQDGAELPAAAATQACLPVREGGLGLLHLDTTLCAAARVSSALQAQALLAGAHPWAQPLGKPDSPAYCELEQCWHAAGAVPGLQLPVEGLAAAAAGTQPWGQGSLQAAATAAHATATLKAMVAEATQAGRKADARRLLSASDPASGAWLHALPFPGQRVTNQEVSDELCLRLGLPCLPCHDRACPAPRCRQHGDAYGHHALNCRAASSPREVRHNQLMQQWRRIAAAAGVDTGAEPRLDSLAHPTGQERAMVLAALKGKRGDVLFAARGRWRVADFIVSNTFSQVLDSRMVSVGTAAAVAETRKRGLYRVYTSLAHAERDAEFVPAGMDTIGAWGEGSKALLAWLASEAKVNGRSAEKLVRMAKVCVSMARMRGNSRMLAIANRAAAAHASATFQRAREVLDQAGALETGAAPQAWELGMGQA